MSNATVSGFVTSFVLIFLIWFEWNIVYKIVWQLSDPLTLLGAGGGSHCPPKWKMRVLIFFALMTSNFFYLLFILCKYASFGIFFRSIGQLVMVLRPLEDGSRPIFAYLENQFFGSPHQILHWIKYFRKQKWLSFVNPWRSTKSGTILSKFGPFRAKNTFLAFSELSRHARRQAFFFGSLSMLSRKFSFF